MTAECKNCGTALAGHYCSACGQPADVSIPSVARVVGDALGDLYSFDSRLWHSLLDLTLRPGRMTTAYLEGRRARFTPPFRMYVASSLVFFVILSLGRLGADEPAPVREDTELGANIDQAAQAQIDAATTALPNPTPPVTAAAEDTSIHITADENGWDCNLVDDNTDPAMRARLEAACEKIEKQSGASFWRALADNVPVMMLVFIPLVAAWMRVLYLFARRKYVEHLVFFLHVHTFFFLTATLTMLLGRAAGLLPWLGWPVFAVSLVAWLYLPVYLFLAMRHVYKQGRALTAVKYVLLGGGYLASLVMTLLGLVIVTAVTL